MEDNRTKEELAGIFLNNIIAGAAEHTGGDVIAYLRLAHDQALQQGDIGMAANYLKAIECYHQAADETLRKGIVGENDPRFRRLPQWLIDLIAQHEPTNTLRGQRWHEVEFQMGQVVVQAPVFDGVFVSLSEEEIVAITGIRHRLDDGRRLPARPVRARRPGRRPRGADAVAGRAVLGFTAGTNPGRTMNWITGNPDAAGNYLCVVRSYNKSVRYGVWRDNTFTFKTANSRKLVVGPDDIMCYLGPIPEPPAKRIHPR